MKRIAAAFAAACLLLSACSSSDGEEPATTAEAAPPTTAVSTTATPTTSLPTTAAPTTTTPATTTTAPTTTLPDYATTMPLPDGAAPPAPSGLGPYAIGRTQITVADDATGRTLPVDLWYPIDPGTSGEPAIYEFVLGIALESSAAVQDAPPSADGPFPLVIYSHGLGGQSYIATFFTETLASHGFVVAAPNHVGSTATDYVVGTVDPLLEAAYDRPRDTAATITEVLARSANPTSSIAGLVDPERIGMAGHSFGGLTSFAAAGGLPDSTYGAVPADDRIDAIAAMAPATSELPDEVLTSITVPMLVITGTDDVTTPLVPESTRPFELVSGGYAYRIDLEEAAHQSFTDVCDYLEKIPLLRLVDAGEAFEIDGCLPGQMPIERANELTNQYVISFLQAHVAGNDQYRLLLTPEAAADDSDIVFFVR